MTARDVASRLSEAAEIALAIKIAQDIECDRDGSYSHRVYLGALAAIRATSEAAAGLIDQCNRDGPYNAIGAATAIRNGDHLSAVRQILKGQQ